MDNGSIVIATKTKDWLRKGEPWTCEVMERIKGSFAPPKCQVENSLSPQLMKKAYKKAVLGLYISSNKVLICVFTKMTPLSLS